MPPLPAKLLPTLLLSASLAATLPAAELQSRRLHLGKAGQFEWEEYRDRPVDAEKLVLRFPSSANATEQTLRIWQSNVKLNWPVSLNGKKLGILTTSETPLESVFAIPPGGLIDGENKLVIDAPPQIDDIEVGPIALESQPVKTYLGAAQVSVKVTDGAEGAAIPCRFTLSRPDGTLQPLLAEPSGGVAARVGVIYTRDGRATISVPPGDYVLYAGRGFEWGVEKRELHLAAGESPSVAISLRREVDTRGWIAADSHIHTLTFSGHGDATVEERMITLAGEGIELPISTDHNHHTNYAPVAASVGVPSWFTPVVGNEVTTKRGHFNAFPIAPGAPLVNAAEQDWAKLIPAIRSTPGVKVITLNHPRDLHSGFVPFGDTVFDPKTGQHSDADALKIDGIEVVTSGALQSDPELLFRDWFALLNRGHRFAALASSDSHDVTRFIVGQGRTYVAADDRRPGGIDLDEVWRSYQQGRLLVSLGLLVNMKVEDRFQVGNLATGIGETLHVEIVVSGPSWIQADRLVLYANGIPVREEALRDDHRLGEKARVRWELLRPAHDVFLVAVATGPGVREPYWETPRPYQPTSQRFEPRVIGATNPIWIDADGDGKFDSAHAIAQRLLREAGGDRAKASAGKLDQAVRTQLESLTP